MRRPWIPVALVLLVGLAGTALALAGREGDPQFVSAQDSLQPVAPGALERLILTTSDPRPGFGGRARHASCRRGSEGGLGDPWSCSVRYPRPPRIRYRVTVYADRSISGSGQPEAGPPVRGRLVVGGCCVAQGA
jgi:hypothetical protein